MKYPSILALFLAITGACTVWAQVHPSEESLGHKAFAAGNYRAATAHYQKSIAKEQSGVDVEFNLVRAYLHQERINEARALLDELIHSASEYSKFWVLRGDFFRQTSDWESAKECYEVAIEKDSTNAIAYLSLGQALSQLGDEAGAEDAFDNYRSLSP